MLSVKLSTKQMNKLARKYKLNRESKKLLKRHRNQMQRHLDKRTTENNDNSYSNNNIHAHAHEDDDDAEDGHVYQPIVTDSVSRHKFVKYAKS
jgi:hypothetical protein